MIYLCPEFHGQNYCKKMNVAEKIKKKNRTIYQIIAEKQGVTVDFVGRIARGERIPTRGKGLQVKKELDLLIN